MLQPIHSGDFLKNTIAFLEIVFQNFQVLETDDTALLNQFFDLNNPPSKEQNSQNLGS